MNAPTAGKRIVDHVRDRGIRALGCRTWLQLSCNACTSSFSISSEGSKLSTKGPSNASPMPGLNPIGQSHPGSLNAHVAQSLGEMTASLAAAASLALSIAVLSFAQTLLATFSKPVSDQRKSLLGFETLASFSPLPLGFLKPRRDSHWVTNLDSMPSKQIIGETTKHNGTTSSLEGNS